MEAESTPHRPPAGRFGRALRGIGAGARTHGFAYLAGLATVLVIGLGVVETGAYDVAASTPHTRPVYWALTTTMQRAVRREAAGIAAPRRFTQAQVEAGFRIYDAHCVACHGAAGVAPSPLATGMMPPPPYLLDAPQRWRPAELYWIIRNGLKMTPMPAWDRQLDERQTWDLVAFLQTLPGLTYPGYLQMRARNAGADARSGGSGR